MEILKLNHVLDKFIDLMRARWFFINTQNCFKPCSFTLNSQRWKSKILMITIYNMHAYMGILVFSTKKVDCIKRKKKKKID